MLSLRRACQLKQLRRCQRGHGFRHVLVDNFAVRNQRGAVRAFCQRAVVRDNDDGFAFRHQIIEQSKHRLGCL